ncbi:imidazoleglycerol-phosphate dehydratase HisB [bacterium BMS3Abin03]|nr:imidazoleglycerol-phosphate dehydratase HisB [bacterium BMS3Abin03]
MNKVVIDKEYFDINSSKAAGLISGLKKLSQMDFSIEVSSKQFNDTLNKILYLEGITINDDKAKTENIFEIDSSGLVKKNENILNKKSPVKNLDGAIEIVLKNLRTASVKRKTKETDIRIELSLDGNGKSKISTGIGFFDHMLEQIARHSNINLNIKVKGDLHIDEHHTIEDTGLAMGEALREALGNKKGIKRYGFLLPMDDSIAQCTIDLGGRSYLNFKCKFDRNKVGEFPTELTEEFFRAISSALKANIYIRAKGKNDHHKIESIFKAFAKALNEACRFDERNMGILPSTKGML